jgi:hypothetical protein
VLTVATFGALACREVPLRTTVTVTVLFRGLTEKFSLSITVFDAPVRSTRARYAVPPSAWITKNQ